MNTSRIRASRTAAALGTVLAAATLALGAAGPAQAINCAPGSVPAVAGNGAEFCAVSNTGGVGGGGSVSIGGGGSTVPGLAGPIVGGGGGAPLQPAPYAPAPAPYVPPVPAPAPVYAPAPAPVQNGYTPAAPNTPVKGVAGTAADNPVIEGVPAEAPAPEAVPAESPVAAATTEATPVAASTPTATPSATPSATASAAAIQSEPAAQTDNGTAPRFIIGGLAVLAVAAGAVYWRRKVKGSGSHLPG